MNLRYATTSYDYILDFAQKSIPLSNFYLNFNKTKTVLFFLFKSRAGVYLFKVKNGNIRKMCEIFSKLTIKEPVTEPYLCVFIISFEHISLIVLIFTLLT